MTPPEILQASETALNTWVEQKVLEFREKGKLQSELVARQKKMEEAIQARLQEAETACNGLEADQSKLQQKIEEIEKENSKTYEELKKLKAELADSEEQYHNLQKRILGDQRQDLFHRPLVEASARRNTLLSSASPMKAPSHRHGLGSFPESFPKQPQQQHQQPHYINPWTLVSIPA